MKILLFLISTFHITNLVAQASNSYAIFKTEDFTNINSKTVVKTEKINIDGLLDLNFYRNHFYIPYYFPEKLIDKSFRNEIVTVWRDTIAKKDYNTNWTNAYTYDQKSRVVGYSFSGCLICSNLPYTIKLFYNEKDEVLKMEKYYSLTTPGLQMLSVDSAFNKNPLRSSEPVETFIFQHDNTGNIVKLNYFWNKKLSKRISRT